MKGNEQLRKEFEEQTGNKAIVFPACHGETGYASWEYQLWLEQKLLEEYAQQFRSPDMAEALSLLDMASSLVGNPGTNISSSTDLACDSWQEKYKKSIASLAPGVEDGSGWVKVEDRLPENAGWVNDTVMFWSKKHGHALIGCYDFEFDDWTQQPWTEGAEKLKSSDVTHWRPLPTPPDVEDNQTKKIDCKKLKIK